MNNEKSDFLSPVDPMIIVKKITKEVVEDKLLDDLLNKVELIDIENSNLIDFNINNL